MNKEYYKTRQKLQPVKGRIYENAGGGHYICVKSNYPYVFRNVRSGWTFIAHNPGVYQDDRIDWDYSTDGYFVELNNNFKSEITNYETVLYG